MTQPFSQSLVRKKFSLALSRRATAGCCVSAGEKKVIVKTPSEENLISLTKFKDNTQIYTLHTLTHKETKGRYSPQLP